MQFKLLKNVAAFGVVVLTGASAQAAFQVANSSFQTDVPGVGSSSVSSTDGDYGYPGNPPEFAMPGWTVIGDVAGVWNPTSEYYTGAAGAGTPSGADGHLVGFTNGANGFYQNAGEIEASDVGNPVTLTVAVGQRLQFNYAGYNIALYVGETFNPDGVPVASAPSGVTPTGGTFTDVSTTPYMPTVGQVGQSLFIRITGAGTGAATDFDNVRLTVVPEPASLGLLATCFLLLARRRRI